MEYAGAVGVRLLEIIEELTHRYKVQVSALDLVVMDMDEQVQDSEQRLVNLGGVADGHGCSRHHREHPDDCHHAIFHAHFFYRFLNLVTNTLVHLFHFSLVILVFHLAFTLSTCYSTNDFHELL